MPFFRYPWKWFFGKEDVEKAVLAKPQFEQNLFVNTEDKPSDDEPKLPIKRNNAKQVPASSNSLEFYLSNSYKELGYKDAFDHPDIEYLNVGKRYLVNNMESLHKKAIESLAFEKDQLEYLIRTHESLGEMETVNYLRGRLTNINLKLDRIHEFLKDMESHTGELERVLLSYERGFRRGLAEIWSSKF